MKTVLIMEDEMLKKYLNAQASTYETVRAELEAGKKRSHWMWYIFPQIAGLGSSETSKFYALSDIHEAERYHQHPDLGTRLLSLCHILLGLPSKNAFEIFGSPDDMKLKSCMTLFSLIPGADPVFCQVLEKFFDGGKDQKTVKILENQDSGSTNL